MERIESSANGRIKEWAKLLQKKERDRTGKFLAEGDHLIQEALEAGLVEVLISDHAQDYTFEPKILLGLTPKKPDRILMLDGIQDPGNLGTLIRTAVSFGYDLIVCSKQTADLYNDKVIRSTQGSLLHIPVLRTDLASCVKELQKQGITVIATTLEKAVPLKQMERPERFAVILGNEGSGVAHELQDLADIRVRIEMDGFESLNVAVAGGIMMYELSTSEIQKGMSE